MRPHVRRILSQGLTHCRSLHRLTTRPFASSSDHPSPLPPPPVPLSEREASHAVALADVWDFYKTQVGAVDALSARFSGQDSAGPSAQDLRTELEWIMEDTLIAEARIAASAGASTSAAAPEFGPWRPIRWPSIKLEASTARDSAALQAKVLKSRLSMPEISELWRRRCEERQPLQYLTNQAAWRDFVLAVEPGVLIPRPETEQLIDFAAEFLSERAATLPEKQVWADLGTGSGAIAVGLARILPPSANVFAIDLNPVAVRLAALNAARLLTPGTHAALEARLGSWFDPLASDPELEAAPLTLTGILSNPPYIPRRNLAGLQAEVRMHEPMLALDGGEGEGRDALDAIVAGARGFLAPGGLLALETDGGAQAARVAAAMAAMGYVGVRVGADYYGVERFVVGRWKA